MANSTKLPPVSEFSVNFAHGLREVMAERGVTQTKVADAIGRDQTFVSERTSGKRAADTDIIAGIAEVANVLPRTIVSETLTAMRRAAATDQSRSRPKIPSRRRRKTTGQG